MRTIFYQIYTERFYTTNLFTVQSRNILLHKYAVHLFHHKTINVSTECKHETLNHLPYRSSKEKNTELKIYFITAKQVYV